MGSLQSTGSGLIGTGRALSGMHVEPPIRAQPHFHLFCFYMLPYARLSHVYDSCNCPLFLLLVVMWLHQQNWPNVSGLLDVANT